MKHKIMFCLLLLFSCKAWKFESTIEELKKSDRSKLEVSGKHFSIGTEIDSVARLTYGNCDCCSGELFFQTDSIFILADFCQNSEDYFSGEYIVTNRTIKLIYNEKSFSLKYNWDQEVDENAPLYFLSNSKSGHIAPQELDISSLDERPVLSFKNEKYYAMERDAETRNQFVEKLNSLNIPIELQREIKNFAGTTWIRSSYRTNEIDTVNFLTNSSAEIHLGELGWTFNANYFFNSDTLVTEIISQEFEMNDVSNLKPDVISYYILGNGELKIVKHIIISSQMEYSTTLKDLEHFGNFKRIK